MMWWRSFLSQGLCQWLSHLASGHTGALMFSVAGMLWTKSKSRWPQISKLMFSHSSWWPRPHVLCTHLWWSYGTFGKWSAMSGFFVRLMPIPWLIQLLMPAWNSMQMEISFATSTLWEQPHGKITRSWPKPRRQRGPTWCDMTSVPQGFAARAASLWWREHSCGPTAKASSSAFPSSSANAGFHTKESVALKMATGCQLGHSTIRPKWWSSSLLVQLRISEGDILDFVPILPFALCAKHKASQA